MKYFLSNILSKFAIVIVLLHTFTPHLHEDELTVNEHTILHQKSNSVLGFLKVFFHESNDKSLDDLLLADYGENFNLDFTLILFKNSYREIVWVVEKQQRSYSYNIVFIKTFIVVHNGVRGSPLV